MMTARLKRYDDHHADAVCGPDTSLSICATSVCDGCAEVQVEYVARFVKKVMAAGMNEVLNSSIDANHPERVPVKVDVEIVRSWAGE